MPKTKLKKTFMRGFALRSISLFFCFVLSLFDSGCAIYSDICYLGTTRTEFSDYRYEMSPNRDEIVFTSKKTKEYNYLPLYGLLHHKPAWTSVSTVEERIPLDPMPSNLSRCGMIVETSPDAPSARFLPHVSIPESVDLGDGVDRRIMSPDSRTFILYEGDGDSNYAEGIYEFTVMVDEFPLREGVTFHLRVRPEDVRHLAKPFRVRLVRRGEETDSEPAVDPDPIFLQGYGNVRTVGNFRRDSSGEPHLMFPVSAQDGRYELLTDLGAGPDAGVWLQMSEGLYPFRRNQLEEIENEYRDDTGGTPTTEAICWKVLWFPGAVVADVIAIPVYIFLAIDFMFIHPPTR